MAPRKRPLLERLWEKIDICAPEECWNWTASITKAGRPVLKDWNGGVSVGKNASRWIYELTVGPVPDGLYVCHSCDNPLCCNPSHLFLGTPKENTQDMISKGRFVGNLKLTFDQVSLIRQLAVNGNSQRSIARQTGVSRTHIGDLLQGRVKFWHQN